MTIATTAPSGNVGRHLVRALVRAGTRPRVLGHRPESIEPELRGLVDGRVIDLADRAGLARHLDGATALFLTVPAVPAADPVAEYERFGSAVVAALADSTVERVVLQSSVGAELRNGAGEIDGLARVEELLDATGCSVLHLRAGFFFTNLLLQLEDLRAGEITTVLPRDHAMAWVAPVDIAHVAAGWLLRTDWSGRHVRAVHGPRDLTWPEAMRIVTEVTGHEVTVRVVDDETMRAALASAGMTDRQVEALVGMSTGLRDGFTPEQPRDPGTTTPTTLAAWAVDELRPLLAAAYRPAS